MAHICQRYQQHRVKSELRGEYILLELLIILPYAINIIIFVHLIDVGNQLFKKHKLLIILKQSRILGTESVTDNSLVKFPNISVFLPPRNDKWELICIVNLKQHLTHKY
jgi:hypothetical protein